MPHLAGNCVQVHASCVSVAGTGVLILGPSGVGKSDLALGLIDCGAMLIADDRVELSLRDAVLWARAPDRLRGLLEVRGIGLVPVDTRVEGGPVGLVVELGVPDRVPRLPVESSMTFLGHTLPHLVLAPIQASLPAKVRLAVRLLGQGRLRPVPDGL